MSAGEGVGLGVGLTETCRQPGANHSEVAFDGRERDAENLGRFGAAAPEEGAQFHQLGFPWVERPQLVDGCRKVEELVAVGVDERQLITERDTLAIGAALLRFPGANLIDQDVPHDSGGKCEESPPVLETVRLLFEELEIQIVNERGRLQRAWPLAAQEPHSHAMQVRIHIADELIQRSRVAAGPSLQQRGDVARILARHGHIVCSTAR